jgi:hypothetical protein
VKPIFWTERHHSANKSCRRKISVFLLAAAFAAATANAQPTAVPSAQATVTLQTEPASGAVRFSPGVQEVARMYENGVEPKVIRTYIETSGMASRPSADEIIVLHKRGMPDELITALLNSKTPEAPSPAVSQNNSVGASSTPVGPGTQIAAPQPTVVAPTVVTAPPQYVYVSPSAVSTYPFYAPSLYFSYSYWPDRYWGYYGGYRPYWHGYYGAGWSRSYGHWGAPHSYGYGHGGYSGHGDFGGRGGFGGHGGSGGHHR